MNNLKKMSPYTIMRNLQTLAATYKWHQELRISGYVTSHLKAATNSECGIWKIALKISYKL